MVFSQFRDLIDQHFHQNNHEQVIDLLSKNRFPEEMHEDMLQFWYESHYRRVEKERESPLDPDQKYRLRRRYPPPFSVWGGEKEPATVTTLNSRDLLKNAYNHTRYPTVEERRVLSMETGLPMKWISQWFRNKRCADKNKEFRPSTANNQRKEVETNNTWADQDVE